MEEEEAEESPAARKGKTFSELVHVESQCKIANFELDHQSRVLKEAYLQMSEAIEEQERFKVEMVEQLHELIYDSAVIMLTTMKSLFKEFDELEDRNLE